MISSDIRKAGPYAGDGAATVFPFAFKVFSASDVIPVFTNAAGAETPMVAGFTVSLNSNQDAQPGGTVTLTAPLATGTKLTLTSNVSPLQPMQITNGGGFFPRVLNDSADRAIILIQQLAEKVGRTLLAPVSSNEPVNGLQLPSAAARAGKLLAFDGAGALVPVSSAAGPGDGGLRTDLGQSGGAGLVGTGLGGGIATVLGFINTMLSSTGSTLLGYIQAGTGAVSRTVQDKLRERRSIRDFGGVGGASIVAPMNAALTALGTVNAARLVIPEGVYTIGSNVDWSAYKNVTLVLEPGAVINHGAFNVTLPERVEVGLGAGFVGTGTRTVKNKDMVPLTIPPGGFITAGNLAWGVGALGKNVSGINNFAWGFNALASNVAGSNNIAIGEGALQSNVGTPGADAAYGTYKREAWGNIAIGGTALRDNTTGYENIAIGWGSCQRNTTGRWNTVVGDDSLILNTTGSCNSIFGAYAMVTPTVNNSSVFGWAAAENHTGGALDLFGYVAMNASEDSQRCAAFGSQAGEKWKHAIDSICMGQEVARNMTRVTQGVYLGAYCAGSSPDTGATAVVNQTFVGFQAGLNSRGNGNSALGTGALNTITTETNCFGIGQAAAVTGSNQGQLGDSNVTVYAYGAIQNRSDIRDKADVRDTTLGLDFIMALRPVDFRWDRRDEYRTEPPVPPTMERPGVAAPKEGSPTYEADKAAYDAVMEPYEAAMAQWRADTAAWAEQQKLANITHDGSKKRNRYHHGLIAQEVKAVLDERGIDFGGFQDHSVNGGDDVLSIGYEELIGPLIRSVQELSTELRAVRDELNELKAKN